MSRLRIIIGTLLAAAIILFFIGATAFTDWLLFVQLGYEQIFVTSWVYRLGVGFGFGVVTFMVLALNIWLAKVLSPNIHFISKSAELEQLIQKGRVYLDRYFALAAYTGSAVVATLVGISMAAFWEVWLKYFSYVSSGVKDPLFGKDVSFYFFILPAIEIVQSFLWFILLLALGLAVIVHLIRGSFNIGQGLKAVYPKARIHLTVLGALVLVVLSVEWWVAAFKLVYSSRGVVFGASYTDVYVQLPAYNTLVIVTATAALLLIISGLFNRWGIGIMGIVAVGVVWIVGSVALPVVVQQYRVAPNEFAKEEPFIAKGIKFTRKAFALEDVERKKFPALSNLTRETLEKNSGTIDSLRLWDWRPLKKTYSQIQEIRLYYSFRDVDLDRYFINGQYRQMALSAREMITDDLPAKAKSWINQHLVYTHGYGVVASPVNEVTKEGLPELTVKNIPPTSTVSNLEIDRPEIYYGEAPDDYAIIKTKTKEFNYPAGDHNEYTDYKGNSGIELSNYWRRLAFSYRFGTAKLLISDALTSESRIMFHRNIIGRLQTVAPFLSYDSDPYIVIDKGRLFWIVDAYTMTNRYPYAEPAENGQNYIRNSVKAVVDAYSGDIDFYIADDKDPIIAAYARAFPGVFKPLKSMEKSLLKHIRYPEVLFKIQAEVYSSFHMTDPQVFFGREDLWALPNEIYDTESTVMDPYYMIMQLPGETKQEFALILPFTPTNKNNMIAWLAARSDAPNYGKLALFTFPKDKLVFGPLQIESRLDQDTEISRQLSLWNQRGSRVIRGNLLVVPIDESILYVEPIYLQAEASEFPELKRVAAALGDKVVMEETLEEALNSLLGEEVSKPPSKKTGDEKPATREELVQKASEAFDKSEKAQKDGDWAEYGRQLEILKDALKNLAD